MAKRASKAQDGAVQIISMKFDGGLNYAQSPANISDNELVRMLNYIYNSQTGTPEIRPGTTCTTTLAAKFATPILKIFYYERSSTEAWLVGVSGGKLYYLDTDIWTEIGSLNDAVTVPSFVTFNAKLLVADGGTNIKTWDGTTFGALSDGLAATALAVIGNRVVANSSTSNDLVTLTGPNDETHWNTSTEGAVAVRAGFGDNMAVNGFAVFGDDLIISKKGDAEKRLYRLNVSASDTTSWYVAILTENNCAQNAHCLVGAFNNVFFIDTNGFKSIKGVTEYGDLQVDLIGSKVNTLFTEVSSCDGMAYLPLFTAIWYMMGDRVFAYHRITDGEGVIHHAFTDLVFQQGRIRSVCQAGDVIYLAGNNGYLYQIDSTVSTDETAPDTTSAYTSVFTTKKFPLFGNGIVRRTELYLKPLASGTATLTGITPANESIALKTITLRGDGEYLYDATGYLNDATDELYSMGTAPWFETSFSRFRGASIQFQIASSSGRVGIEGLKTEVALVGGV